MLPSRKISGNEGPVSVVYADIGLFVNKNGEKAAYFYKYAIKKQKNATFLHKKY